MTSSQKTKIPHQLYKSKVQLMDMPHEMLEKIMSYIPAEDRFDLRLVCRRFRDVLDCVVGHHAKFSGLMEITSSKIPTNIVYRSILFFNWNWKDENIRCDMLIPYPKQMEGFTVDSQMDVEFFKRLVDICFNVNNLHIYGKLSGPLNYEDSFKLPRLKSLDIRMPRINDSVEAAIMGTQNTLTILEHLIAPNINIFCIELWLVGPLDIVNINHTVVTFLKKNGPWNLQKFFICLRPKKYKYGDQEILNDINPLKLKDMDLSREQSEREELRRLGQKIQLKSFLGALLTKKDIWIDFLEQQKQLVKFGVCDDFGNNKWPTLGKPLRNNSATLKTVYIMSRFILGEDYIDLSVFHNCDNLEELLIVNTDTYVMPLPQEAHSMGSPHFKSFDSLLHLKNLEFLALTNLFLDERKLNIITECKSLKHLALLNNNSIRVEGVKKLLNMRLLTTLLVDGVITPTISELDQIREILSLLVEDDNYGPLALNIQSENSDKRWWKGPEGFIFDIDFYAGC